MKLNMNMVIIHVFFSKLLFNFVEETIEYYLDSMLNNSNQHELIDLQTSQCIDDIRSVSMIFV